MENQKKRVMFTFDEASLKSLQKLKEDGGFPSMAEAVRRSLQINKALREQSAKGFTEIVVKNPSTGEERVMVIPELTNGS
ncbi:hypothetical protein SAMN02745216_00625 [Desulfatibacillum alkenivorans DSM 16219]|jgi:hypothetical protein|uniref:Ribbon-helix-helix protein, copG family n=1 Tax=Desulfatibacillum alkenivorans DSM 16219 TaxID=1121393 RepID=A0A1M6EDI9_9BACT|nr:hypothetical protein [Desulfatibacillum alkenivorans]SHI83390.1 hypothetical protein SAMN02745216_00625 [Desulfatibacillum alkenivorans DSM 16219]